MANYYFKRGNWGYNPYKKWKSSSTKSSTRGQYKAAAQQRDTISFVIKTQSAVPVGYTGTGSQSVSAGIGAGVINIYDVLRREDNFRQLALMYDQVKVTGIKAKLNVVDSSKVSDLNEKPITILLGWDRNGVNRQNILFYDSANHLINSVNDGDTQTVSKLQYKLGAGLRAVSSKKKSIINNSQRWTGYANLYPSSIEEKGCYLSTENFKEFTKEIGAPDFTLELGDNCAGLNISDLSSRPNPCISLENASIKWKPILYISIFRSGFTSTRDNSFVEYGEVEPLLFNIDWSISVVFRGMKPSVVP